MYKLRLKILIGLFIAAAVICLFRLIILQVFHCGDYRLAIAEKQILEPQPLPTLRGNILDRRGNVLAKDVPAFYVHVSYQLTRLLDERFWEGMIDRQSDTASDPEFIRAELQALYAEEMDQLNQVIGFASRLEDNNPETIQESIRRLNNRIWEMASYVYWRRTQPTGSLAQYRQEKDSIEPADIVSIRLWEMLQVYPIYEITPDQLIGAQIELGDLKGVEIRTEGIRDYPYQTAACHLLGWVGLVQENEKEYFSHDEYLRYLEGELIGKAGIERMCEPILRGRRGEVIYDKDGNLIHRKEPQYGRDVRITLDIQLQQQIEHYLENPNQNPDVDKVIQKGVAAVVMDAATGDILAMVSTPLYNLNTIRQKYAELFNDPNTPMFNKAMQVNYPPGSTIKPLIMLAGLEESWITPTEVISCPDHPPPPGWPSCLAQSRFHNCHDWRWAEEGGNIARNAIRGSCNIYFSRLADRLNSGILQRWLFDLGYGRRVLPPFEFHDPDTGELISSWGTLPQAHGSIIFGIQPAPYTSPDQIKAISRDDQSEKRFWGIGQGNLRVTVLQVANALAAIVRGGIYKPARLVYLDEDPFNQHGQQFLNISRNTLSVIREGMHAAVYEPSGTAYDTFRRCPLREVLAIYGKTGSTENPEMAWFECFAEDSSDRSIIIVAAVPGGLSGSGYAAPLGKEILQMCYDTGYIGIKNNPSP